MSYLVKKVVTFPLKNSNINFQLIHQGTAADTMRTLAMVVVEEDTVVAVMEEVAVGLVVEEEAWVWA